MKTSEIYALTGFPSRNSISLTDGVYVAHDIGERIHTFLIGESIDWNFQLQYVRVCGLRINVEADDENN